MIYAVGGGDEVIGEGGRVFGLIDLELVNVTTGPAGEVGVGDGREGSEGGEEGGVD